MAGHKKRKRKRSVSNALYYTYSTKTPLTLTKVKLIPLYILQNLNKNQNQDIKSLEKSPVVSEKLDLSHYLLDDPRTSTFNSFIHNNRE